MAQETAPDRGPSHAYDMFILVLTVISLVNMLVMLLPLDDATIGLLHFYDLVICVIFFIDFWINLRAAPKKSDYFVSAAGWTCLDQSLRWVWPSSTPRSSVWRV